MFKYGRILVLLVAIGVTISSGCTQASKPQLGLNSGLKDVPQSKVVPRIIN